MSDSNQARLTPLAQRGPRRGLFTAVVRVLLLGGLLAKLLLCRAEELDCAKAVRDASDGVAVAVCQREYARTQEPRTGIRLADSLRHNGDRTAARAVATELLIHAEVRADAHQILGKIATAEGRASEAIEALEKARTLHRAANQRADLARDNMALAKLQYDSDDYASALRTVHECIEMASAVDDRLVQGYCHLTAARVLQAIGQFLPSQDHLELAEKRLTSDRDRAKVIFEQGNLAQEIGRGGKGRYQSAIALHRRALAIAKEVGLARQVLTSTLNLVYSLAEYQQVDEAQRLLDEAAQLDPENQRVLEREQLAARIAYRSKNYLLAMTRNATVYNQMEPGPDRIEVAAMQARMALETGDLAVAEQWAQRGIDDVEELHRRLTVAELRPWVLGSRREPYELRFTALVRAGRMEDAFLAFSRWQARSLADALAKQSVAPGLPLSGIADQLSELQRLLPAAPRRAIDERALLDALRGARPIDLLALAVVDGEVWRLTASRGRLQAESLLPFDRLTGQLDELARDAITSAAASSLGELLVPVELFRNTEEPLYLVLDPKLVTLPFVALRRNGRPLISARPVVRAPSIPTAVRCDPRPAITNAVVIADAQGNLEHARSEAATVKAFAAASKWQITSALGAEARKQVLDAVRPDSLAHFAMHAGVGTGGGDLRFHDGRMSALEISTRKVAPALVVLSACATAQSDDPELARALSTAFLASGVPRVVGTLRSVSDRDTVAVSKAFYEGGGVVDPIRALAKAQAKLAETSNKMWPYFAVFVNDTCAALAR